MKTELTDINETRKSLSVEIPSDVVAAEIDRVAHGYAKHARLPGFRPGKVPQGLVRKRYRDEIFHEVLHDLVPRAVSTALQERGIEPVDTPSITDVVLEEGQPLRFTAAIETVPLFDPGDLSSITIRRPSTAVTAEAVEEVLQRLRERAGKYEPVEARPVTESDTVVLDVDRTGPTGQVDHHDGVTVQLGAPGNPPGFDANLIGMSPGESKTFSIQFPESYPAPDLANTAQTYAVTLTGIRRKVLPELDDEFAKDASGFDSIDALRGQVRADLEHEAEANARQEVRRQLLSQLSQRITFDPPGALVEREMDRRIEELVRQLKAERISPEQAGLDWGEFREAQRPSARSAVASALALDEIARREGITVAPEDVDKEVERFAIRAGRTPAAVRAQLEKDGGISSLYLGLRREKTVDMALSRAKIASE